MTQPILVNATPTSDQLYAAVRQIGMAVGAWAIGKGYLQADTATALGTIALVAVPFVYGQLKTRLRAQQLATVASSPKVPDSVASIKE
jgi:hypothetical protein